MKEKLLKIQEEVGTIKRDSTNPFFDSKYFDINSLLAAVKPVLTKHKVVLLQGLSHMVVGTMCIPMLDTIIMDTESDSEIKFSFPLPTGLDPQKMGGAITYIRRYALQSVLALEAVDDDGNTASDRKPDATSKEMPKNAPKTAKRAPVDDDIPF